MTIPLSYNIRNLIERRTTTVMTALGIALTVAVLLAVLAFVEGLRTSLAATGNPLHVLVLRRGATAELTSIITRQWFQDLRLRPGIARNERGEPMASLEMVTVVVLESPEAPGGMNVTVRGLMPIGFEMREQCRVVQGRMFEPGKRELVVGKSIARRYPGAGIGQEIDFGSGDWTVVGIMDCGRSAANSEIFADLNQLAADQNRSEALSSVLLRAVDEAAVQALINELENDRRLNVSAMTERAYYEQQQISAAPVLAMGTFVSIIMAVGSCFAAMNTMYAAVARRSAEIGTLRVLGFSRWGILTSFTIEALLLSLAGGVLGLILVLPLTNVTTGMGNFVTFAEVSFNFRVTPRIAAGGILFSLFMGLLGGLFPAASAARKQILDALRQV